MRTLAAALALTALLTSACGAGPVPEPEGVTVLGADVPRREPRVAPAEVERLTAAQVDFALDLYRAADADADADLVVGPGSLHTALSMVLAGARGRTAAELAKVLHLRGLEPRLHELNNVLDRELRFGSQKRGVRLDIANRIWAARLQVEPEYAETVATDYGAGLAALDIAGDPEEARAAVNRWVAESTHDKIEEMFRKGTITADTRLVLANALHLDADWRFPFPADATSEQPFRLADGSTVQVPTMRYDEYLPTGAGRGWSAVRLPYAGRRLAMTVIVPEDLRSFERTLNADVLEQVEANIRDGGIHLSLPRFTARTHLALADTLAEMGMPFRRSARVRISRRCRARACTWAPWSTRRVVEVDEEGTEAAAASGGAVQGSHGPTVTVDRPFLFGVRDQPTGSVLFLGRVTDPR